MMTVLEITNIIRSHAFDMMVYNADIISDKLTKKAAEYIYSQYIDLLSHQRDQNYLACESLINSLIHTGYYVDTVSIKRMKTIESIIGDDIIKVNVTV
jgi:hypothetical protein